MTSAAVYHPLSKVGNAYLYAKFLLTCLLVISALLPATGQVQIAYDSTSAPIVFGVDRLRSALRQSGEESRYAPLGAVSHAPGISVAVMQGTAADGIAKEGFRIAHAGGRLLVTARDAAGAMYGAMEVAELLSMGRRWQALPGRTVNPHAAVRALKFNLPWSSYRVGPAMDAHLEVCRDLRFWQKFIDQMAVNRFNVLSLWNVHPFSYMVKPVHFPGANNFNESEMAGWKHFWTSLFRMARERGIEPFLVNWNIAVSPEFARAYHVKERNDTSAIVKRYTKEVVTQVIDEYPDLAGIGITLADWMSNFSGESSTLPTMTPKDREDWIEQTVVAGIKAASRPVKFIHRSVLSSDPSEMRRIINGAGLPDTTLVEIKFNWSHGHSTPLLALTHDSNNGTVDDGYWNPLPVNYRIEWMIRNEDFFILRWGQPAFIRQHIARNSAPYVNGYFVGSEGYIPAKDLAHLAGPHKTWDYAFEKQWLFYMLWGRLLYDPCTPDAVFAAAFEARYGKGKGAALLEAYSAASGMPLKLASFHGSTWDYTLYSEGFLSPFASNGGLHDTASSFISIDELIDHTTLDPALLSISDYVKLAAAKTPVPAGKVTPLQLAGRLEKDGRKTLLITARLRPGARAALQCELDDLDTWAWLSLYFAAKLRAGVALQEYRTTHEPTRQQEAIRLLTACVEDWKKVCAITAAHYGEVPYVDDHSTGGLAYRDARRFSWRKYLPQVERDLELARAKAPAVASH